MASTQQIRTKDPELDLIIQLAQDAIAHSEKVMEAARR
jgi:hypothetical protein